MESISVSGVGKAFKQYPNHWSRLGEWLLPGQIVKPQLRWILRDVSFSVQAGEAVGIIGINGAGKSTLLKMIAGTTHATTGEIRVNGRMAALLELGMGFHPEFTGRQNAVMAGQLLGLETRKLIDLMPAIEAFAEIGDYIDEPVRVYSSGMQVRLAFSVATAVRPDIFIVDEALSVGDAYFQHKSFQRIREFTEQGTTLLLVSHDKAALQAICKRAILLNGGSVAMEGAPAEVMDVYNALIADQGGATLSLESAGNSGTLRVSHGTGEVLIHEVALLDPGNLPLAVVNVAQQVKLRVVIEFLKDISNATVGYLIKDRLGLPIFGTNTANLGTAVSGKAGDRVTLEFGFAATLGDGSYSLSAAVHDGNTHIEKNYSWRDQALVFEVRNFSNAPFVGSNWMPPALQIDRCSL
jgi:lipopolysaccharide transport system ATP-binding protein